MIGVETSEHAAYTDTIVVATSGLAPNFSAYSDSSGMTIVNPSTSTRTIKKIGRSGLRARTMRAQYTRHSMKVMALVACFALGCFGYNSSAKRWAYVGDTILVIGGAAAIGA